MRLPPGDAPRSRVPYQSRIEPGAILPLASVWTYDDLALGLTSLHNLIAVLLLSGVVVASTRKLLAQEHAVQRK